MNCQLSEFRTLFFLVNATHIESMKKITQAVSNAFAKGLKKSSGATRTDGTTLFLWGSPIARHTANGLEISFAGFVTATTAERLNGVLAQCAPSYRVNRRLGTPFISNGNESIKMPVNGWVKIETP